MIRPVGKEMPNLFHALWTKRMHARLNLLMREIIRQRNFVPGVWRRNRH